MSANSVDAIKSVLEARVIAIAGLSEDESKPSNIVARYLISHGKTVIPVNPNHAEILGSKCYHSLLEIPPEIAKTLDIIDVFRRSEDVPQVAREAIELRRRNANGRPMVFWMQLGISNAEAAQEAEQAGFLVVTGRCTKIEHSKLSKSG